jgi:hypothetical protein
MRKLIFLTLMVIIVSGFSQSPPNITRFEYFIDTDPGYGLATPVSIPSSVTQSVSFSANIAPFSDGIHMLYLRMRDANLRWSETFSRQFMKVSVPAVPANITKAEYFIDTDPGYETGTPITVIPGKNQSLNFSADLSAVANGIHSIYIRTRDANYRWSQTFNRQFIKAAVPAAFANITKAEYFIDTDPGYGQAANISIAPGLNQSVNFTADLTSVSKGIHSIYIRTKDANNHWSVTFSRQFYKEDILLPAGNITKAEYFIDTDPGFGSATNISVAPGLSQSLNFTADLTSVTNGIHNLYIRTKDAHNHWGVTFNRQFIKVNIDNSPLSKINLIEYFVDTDPGFGQATQYPVPLSDDSTLLIKDFIAQLPVVSETNHTFYIRVRDNNDKWSHTFNEVYCQGPSAKFTVDPVCVGQISELKFNTSNIDPNTSFFWDVDNNGTVDFTTKGSITQNYLNEGSYFAKLVVINNQICPNNYRDSAIVKVTVNPVPTVSIIPQGNVSICPGDNVQLTASTNQLSTNYQWYQNNIPVFGAINSAFSAAAEGSYTVVITNGSACSATSDITTVSFKAQPGAVITPSGVTDLCPGASVILNANTGSGLTYQWLKNSSNITGETNSAFSIHNAALSDNGAYSVLVSNSLGCSRLSGSVTVTVHPFPVINLGKDTTIASNHSVILNAGNGYPHYLWNDNTMLSTLTVNGSVYGLGVFPFHVTVTDAYGCSGSDSVTVTIVKPVPAISGIAQYENNAHTPLASVKVYLLDSVKARIDSVTTDLQGKYIFSNVKNGHYSLSASSKTKWGGGNPIDALLILRHFVQISLLPTQLKRLGADVNADKKLNPLDALFVNRRFVNLLKSFPSGDWIFEKPSVAVSGDDVLLNINGLCFGDVNASLY